MVRSWPTTASPPCAAPSAGCRRNPSCSPPPSPTISRWAARAPRAPRCSTPPPWPPSTRTCAASRPATTPALAKRASPCPAASASALLADSELLLMDDALSAVDTGTETRILEHLETLRRAHPGRSAIIASHRLSAVANADLIVVLRDGRITERGSHAALLAAEGWYASQWKYQQLEASLDAA